MIEQVTPERSMIAENIMFTRKFRILENLPLTKAALQQHIKRATYQAICWIEALTGDPKPRKLGLKKSFCDRVAIILDEIARSLRGMP